jgi:Na+(H+)/acetate symporter ActP
MSYNFAIILAVAAFACFTLGLGAAVGHDGASSVFKKGAIERGYAQYCPADGAWAWKGECEK